MTDPDRPTRTGRSVGGWRACALAAASLVLAQHGEAHARPLCEPLDESGFRTLVLDAQEAIDRDDPALHESIVSEVRRRIPCMTFAPPPRLWADFLVGMAIVEFAAGRDWEAPMAAALRIRPSVDRGVGAGHPLASWQPPPLPAHAPKPVPEGVSFFVDGLVAEHLPPATGLYLVQRNEGENWATLLLIDREIPGGWFAERIRESPVLLAAFDLSAGIAGGGFAQRTHWQTDYVPSGSDVGVLPTATARATLRYGPLGLAAEGNLAWSEILGASGAKAQIAAGLRYRGFLVGLGGGLASAEVLEGTVDFSQAEPSHAALPYVAVAVEIAGGGALGCSLALSGGAGPSVIRADARVGVGPRTAGPRWRIGAVGAFTSAGFTQEGYEARRLVVARSWRVGAEAGFAVGRER